MELPFLRKASRPNAPRPVAKSGSAPGSGVATGVSEPLTILAVVPPTQTVGPTTVHSSGQEIEPDKIVVKLKVKSNRERLAGLA